MNNGRIKHPYKLEFMSMLFSVLIRGKAGKMVDALFSLGYHFRRMIWVLVIAAAVFLIAWLMVEVGMHIWHAPKEILMFIAAFFVVYVGAAVLMMRMIPPLTGGADVAALPQMVRGLG